MLAHQLADPEKGSGIAMICTFGDITDVVWWRELDPAHPHHRGRATAASRRAMGRRGWASDDPAAAPAYGELAGKHGQARPSGHRRAAGRPRAT